MFCSDQKIVGKAVTLNGESYTVVGVMPPSFQFPSRDDELWTPLAFTTQEATNRNRHYLQVVARLKPGMTVEHAQAEMSTIAARLQRQYPEANAELGAAVVPLHDQAAGVIQ